MGDEEKKIEIPEGIQPMFIQASSLEKYGMKTGESISDTVPFKEFNVVEILEECVNLGFMSDFHGFMKHIEAYQAANGGLDNPDLSMLVVRDAEEKYGDNFYLCITMEARNIELNKAKKEAAAIEAAIKAKEAEEAAKVAAEYARLNAVFVDEPMYAKPYTSVFAEPVSDHGVHHHPPSASVGTGGERPLMLCRVSRPRSSFGGRCPTFGSRDSNGDTKQVEFRPLKNPDFDVQLRVRDVGLQGLNTISTSTTTQTPWYRPVNKGSQFNGYDDECNIPLITKKFKPFKGENKNSKELLLKIESNSIGVGGSPEEEEEETKKAMQSLEKFLTNARGPMEEALQQNETVEIFGDAFSQVGGEASGVGQKGDNEFKELRSFNDIKFSKNMSLACIDWHPSRKAMLAVSPIRNLSFDDRNSRAGRPVLAHVLLWDFADLIHPQIMLEGPNEILCFRFNRNPDQHELIACGCINGQVVLFDTRSGMSKLTERDKSKSSRGSGGGGGSAGAAAARRRDVGGGVAVSSASTETITEMVAKIQPQEGEPHGIEPVAPSAVSTLEFSHRKSVFDLHWLAPDAQIDARGQLLHADHLDGKSYQFMTTSGDGQCLVWDIRFAAIAAGDYPHILKVRQGPDKKKNIEGEQPPWHPLFRMELKRPGGAGDLLPCRLALLCQGHGVGSNGACLVLPGSDEETNDVGAEKKADRRSMFLFSTDGGELAFADWRPSASGNKLTSAKSTKENDDDNNGSESPNYVSWVAQDHVRPAVSLEPSTFFPTLLLSVSDRFFTLWTLGREHACFSSPASSIMLTCGRWSLTRPGVLYIGRQDGCVDIWDLTDSSHKPSATVTVSSTRVTSMEFCSDSAQSNAQLRANPQNSTATQGNQSNRRAELLACGDAGGNLHVLEMPRNLSRPSLHERSLMEAFIHREVKRVDYEHARHANNNDGDNVGDNDEMDDSSPPPPRPPAPSNGDDASESDPIALALAAEEAAYKALEDKFIAELGLTENELPEHWKKAREEVDEPPPPPDDVSQ